MWEIVAVKDEHRKNKAGETCTSTCGSNTFKWSYLVPFRNVYYVSLQYTYNIAVSLWEQLYVSRKRSQSNMNPSEQSRFG